MGSRVLLLALWRQRLCPRHHLQSPVCLLSLCAMCHWVCVIGLVWSSVATLENMSRVKTSGEILVSHYRKLWKLVQIPQIVSRR